MASLHLQDKSSLLNTFIGLSQAISSQGILTDGLLHQGHIKQTVDAPADKILQRMAFQYRQWNGRSDRFVTSTGTSKNTVNPSIISSQDLICSLLKLSFYFILDKCRRKSFPLGALYNFKVLRSCSAYFGSTNDGPYPVRRIRKRGSASY
ncbi:hypothetical protein E4U09_000904 [Claviceps aff. purpurea]|uniref:Uncharacterized protein n=1 Tax=Claviceps aff. purpurea TaxID=1967640 RepID=A0A9P7Q967_9HYPO|nr:hypothetical protein E4U09_000904 [Claviceps aff. purpurea]